MVKVMTISARTVSPFEKGSLPRDGARPVAEYGVLKCQLLALIADRVILLENAIQIGR